VPRSPAMPSETTRRAFLAGTGAGLTGLWLTGTFPRTGAAGAQLATPLARDVAFPSGVVAADPHGRGATVWTRVAGLDRDARLQVEVARDPGFARVVYRQDVLAEAARDFTVHHRIDHPALAPAERYHYRFLTCDADGPAGRFKTATPADSAEPVRIGFFSCQRWEHGFFTPQAGLAAEENLDLVVALGDYLYEEDSGEDVRFDGTGAPNGHVETLAQWRAKHRLYRTDPRLQAMHAAHPFAAIWDDCEVEGNWAGEGTTSGPSPVGERSIPFAAKRANAFRAFFENMPLDRFAGEPTRIHRALRLGANADLFLLDTRQFRDPQPCGDANLRPCPEAETTDRIRLGTAQQRWLEAELLGSRAVWKVLGNAQMMMALDLPPGSPVGVDSWDGYGVERTEVLEFVRANAIRNVTSIVGDVHTFFAGTLTTNGRITGAPVATEFVGTSISHDPLQLADDGETSAAVTNRVMLANPHLVYANFRRRGYAVLEARPEELVVDFKGVSTVTEETADVFTVRSFRVAKDSTVVVPTGGSEPV